MIVLSLWTRLFYLLPIPFQVIVPTTRREAGGIILVPIQIWMESGTEEDITAAAIKMEFTGPNSGEEPIH